MMQWTTSHVHFSIHHDDHHQHIVKTHAHHSGFALFSVQPPSQHTDAIDFSHQIHKTNTIELNAEHSLPKNKKHTPHFDSLTVPSHIPHSPYLQQTNSPIGAHTLAKQNYLGHSTVNPRAPPRTSFFA